MWFATKYLTLLGPESKHCMDKPNAAESKEGKGISISNKRYTSFSWTEMAMVARGLCMQQCQSCLSEVGECQLSRIYDNVGCQGARYRLPHLRLVRL